MMIIMYEVAGENVSVGQGEAQRVNAVPQATHEAIRPGYRVRSMR
jgi:hypothetical protein